MQAKRNEMNASKEAISAIQEDKKAIKEAVKSGEMTTEEAKSAKKQTRWRQFWKSN